MTVAPLVMMLLSRNWLMIWTAELVVFPAQRPGGQEGDTCELGGAFEGDDDRHDQGRDHERAENAQSNGCARRRRGADRVLAFARGHLRLIGYASPCRDPNCNGVLCNAGQAMCMLLVFLGPYVTHIQNRCHQGDEEHDDPNRGGVAHAADAEGVEVHPHSRDLS